MGVVDLSVIDGGFPWRPEETAFDRADGPGGDSSKRGPRSASPDYDVDLHGPTERHGVMFDRVLHAVDDLGWSGDEVNSLPDHDYTLIAVPEGDWVVGRNTFHNTRNWGVVGLGPDVTLRPPENQCLRMLQVSSGSPATNFLVENLEFNQRDGMTAGIDLTIFVEDGLQVRHCERTGTTPHRWSAGFPLEREPYGIAGAISEGGHGLISHWTDHCETRVIDYPYNAQGMFFGAPSIGKLRIEDSSIKNQGEHAIYASKADNVEILRCEFIDNANTNLRIAGGGSWAKDSIFGYQRDAFYTNHKDDKPGKKATKILRCENERVGESGGFFENCEFFSETPGLVGSMVIYVMGSVGATEFRDCLIRNEVDDDGALIQDIGEGWRGKVPPGEDWIRFVGCRFEGDSSSPPIESHRPGLVYAKGCVCSMENAPKAQGLARHGIEYVS